MDLVGKLWRGSGVVRFGAHVMWEGLSDYCPTDPEQVPASAARISPKWLDAVLCRGTPGAAIADIEVVGGSDGTNTRRALRVTYNEAGTAAGLPTELFVKSATAMRTRLMNTLTTRGESEVRFYQDMRSRLPIEAPRAIYAGFDRRSGRMLIIFPNMAHAGTKFLDPSHQITREQAEGMIDLLAGYQSATWNSPELQSNRFFPTTLRYQEMINVRALPFEKCGAVGIDRAAAVLPEALNRIDRDRLWRVHMASIKRSERRAHVLTHYDMHVGNWYITPDGRMGLTDWSMRYGHWSVDLSYMLLSALRIEDRRAWERDLLKRYREQLAAGGINDVPSEEEIWLEYRRQTFHPLYFWLTTIGRLALQPNMQPDHISLANLERMGQAVVDLDSVAAMEEVM
jgi:hypothetical protein